MPALSTKSNLSRFVGPLLEQDGVYKTHIPATLTTLETPVLKSNAHK